MNCSDCGIKQTERNTYAQKDRASGLQSYCKDCFNRRCVERWTSRKLKAIKYLGGSCEKCGGVFHYSVFEFHHTNPEEKDYVWTKLRLRSWKSIMKELDKCQLLCANCHRETHYALSD